MALLISTNGKTKAIKPKNGSDFWCEELNEMIGCDLVQVIKLPDNYYMIVDESGAVKPNKVKNEMATEIYQTIYTDEIKAESKRFLSEMKSMGAVVIELPGNEEMFIYGNAVICKASQFIY